MGVPKQHRSKARQRQRRMHIFLSEPTITVCPKCGKPVLPHNLCNACGYYGGKEVIDVLAKLTKKEKKQKEKEMKAREQEKPLDTKELSKK
jgi:large subunit ribosomal protein L32